MSSFDSQGKISTNNKFFIFEYDRDYIHKTTMFEIFSNEIIFMLFVCEL